MSYYIPTITFQEVINLAAYHRSMSPLSPTQTPRHINSPRSLHASVRPGTRVSGVTEENIVAEIYTHFSGLSHDALLRCIQRSLEIFYRSVCPPDLIRDLEKWYGFCFHFVIFFK